MQEKEEEYAARPGPASQAFPSLLRTRHAQREAPACYLVLPRWLPQRKALGASLAGAQETGLLSWPHGVKPLRSYLLGQLRVTQPFLFVSFMTQIIIL